MQQSELALNILLALRQTITFVFHMTTGKIPQYCDMLWRQFCTLLAMGLKHNTTNGMITGVAHKLGSLAMSNRNLRMSLSGRTIVNRSNLLDEIG